jgi:hypothetical protein
MLVLADSTAVVALITGGLALLTAFASGWLAARTARTVRGEKWHEYRRGVYKRFLDSIDQYEAAKNDPAKTEEIRARYRSRYHQSWMASGDDVREKLMVLRPDRPALRASDSAETFVRLTDEDVQRLAESMRRETVPVSRRRWHRHR